MQLPNCTHPRPVHDKGRTFWVITYETVSDQQALQIVAYYLREAPEKFREKTTYYLRFDEIRGFAQM